MDKILCDMHKQRQRAEFRCQFPAKRVFGSEIPLPDGSAIYGQVVE
jgi:hypothetical protein